MEYNYNITLRDLVVLNALLYYYNLTKKPVSIALIAKELGCSYSSLRYCINKLSEYNLLEKTNGDDNIRDKHLYIPKNDIVFVIDKNTFLVIKDYGVTIQHYKRDMSEYIGKIIPFDQLPEDLKRIILNVIYDPYFFIKYSKLIKKKYFDMLYETIKGTDQEELTANSK